MIHMSKVVASLSLLLCLLPQHSFAWTYDDEFNSIRVSSVVCRAENATDELNIRHEDGMAYIVAEAETTKLYCPLNRRNLSAYDAPPSYAYRVDLSEVSIRLHSPMKETRCRLFLKDLWRIRRPVYGDWQYPSDVGSFQLIEFPTTEFRDMESVNWGLMCEVVPGDGLRSLYALVSNNHL